MSEKDKELLRKCKEHPYKYRVSVDNDCVSVSEINPFEEDSEEWYAFDGEHYHFDNYGQEFIVELLVEFGINAEMC